MNELAPEWQKLRGDKTEEGKTKMKALEQKIDAVEAEQNAEIAAFCKENKDNVLPAYILSDSFYGFEFAKLKELCDPSTAYYNHPMMRRPKMQIESLAKRQPGIKYTDLNMQDMNGAKVKLSQFVGNGKYVLVDFWATWCGPCQMMGPILEELATKHPEIKVGKINVDEQPELATQFQIDAIPALMVFKGGKAAAQTVGLQPIENLEQLL